MDLTFTLLRLIVDRLLSTLFSVIIPRQIRDHIAFLVSFQRAAAWGLLQTCKCILTMHGGKDADVLNERDNVRNLTISLKVACILFDSILYMF